ncbi:MAG TPA: phosphoribosylamine--glycine ligase [Gemmatimonadota bacterium]|nr:phosphoribosylamine--glycine ligase [Gemmatimonadota bacterium]
MKILIVGHGGREHALLWKLHRDHPENEYLFTGHNAGMEALGRAVDASPSNVEAVASLVAAEDVGFTIVGPEVPLAAGLADRLRADSRAVFGPGADGARLEASKAFAKRLMAKHGVPTAPFGVFRDPAAAAAFAHELGERCVVKASGLAAGKGALVCETQGEVDRALDACFVRREFGAAGAEVVVEELLDGEEISLIALTDGEALVPFLPSQDHKRALDGDEGPNTGGMGAYAPVSIADDALRRRAIEEIFVPTLEGLESEGIAFSGVLYAGLMLTSEGPRVLEWNVRFGDPECQALLPLLDSDLLELLVAASPGGGGLAGSRARWRGGACVTVVAASEGYPDDHETGRAIDLHADLTAPDAFEERGVVVFHAGTRRKDGRMVSAGGRVLDVTAVGVDLGEARDHAYAALAQIGGEGLRWRSDIGWRELERDREREPQKR